MEEYDGAGLFVGAEDDGNASAVGGTAANAGGASVWSSIISSLEELKVEGRGVKVREEKEGGGDGGGDTLPDAPSSVYVSCSYATRGRD